MFFSDSTTFADGEDASWNAVRAKFKEDIDAVDKPRPFNGDQLAEELQKHGIKIARRTVAKCRKLMTISPARKRRQY